VSKKKNKFDLTQLVHDGYVKDGETLFFVSDPTKTCKVTKQPNGEYKVAVGAETLTVHAFAQKCLGQEPPNHASAWFRNAGGKTLYDFWHQNDDYSYAA
jgi:hypothetical protein